MRPYRHYTNTRTHHVAHWGYEHRAWFGWFHAKGFYAELILFGLVWRFWSVSAEWR